MVNLETLCCLNGFPIYRLGDRPLALPEDSEAAKSCQGFNLKNELKNGTFFYTLISFQEFLDFPVLDSDSDSLVFNLYLISPISDSPRFML